MKRSNRDANEYSQAMPGFPSGRLRPIARFPGDDERRQDPEHGTAGEGTQTAAELPGMRAILRSGLALRTFSPAGENRAWESAAARLV
jgi:hypothetical protein